MGAGRGVGCGFSSGLQGVARRGSLVQRRLVKAMVVNTPGPAESRPLQVRERAVPGPGPGEVVIQVEACGVCRTDLHVVEGDLAAAAAEITPGHEVVGRIATCGDGVDRVPGDRVGLAWLHRTCGVCRCCLGGSKNLCLGPTFTGWQVDGGYAEYCRALLALASEVPIRTHTQPYSLEAVNEALIDLK